MLFFPLLRIAGIDGWIEKVINKLLDYGTPRSRVPEKRGRAQNNCED